MWTEISRTSRTSGKRPLSGSWRAGDCAASALTAATSILSETRRERERTQPRPIPGKQVELLHSATSYSLPLYFTGGKGLPVAMRALPLVHSLMSLGSAS